MGLPRLERMTGYLEEVCGVLIFLLAALLGFSGAAWWSMFAPVLLLAALRYAHHVKFAHEHPVHGEERVLAMAIIATLANSALFVAFAFVMGRAIAWAIG